MGAPARLDRASESGPPPHALAEGSGAQVAAGWKLTFRALRHRNYRIFAAGQAVSLIGTWMQNVSQLWLIYRLTGSEFLVGAVGFCSHLPVLALGPVAGLAADRFSRYRIVIAAQAAFLLQALALAALTLTGKVAASHVFALALSWGVINAFEVPARQSLFIHMVGKEDLLNAISLNSVVFNSARIVGPSVAGVLIAALGEGACFLINASTFLAVLGSLFLLRLPSIPRAAPASPWTHLRDGFRYVHGHRPVLVLLLVNSVVNIVRAPAVSLAPFFADAIFGRGSRGLGFLTGAAGVGAVAGTLGLARRTKTEGLPRVALYSALTTGAVLVTFAWSPWFAFSLALYSLFGFSQMRQNAAANTLIQTMVPDEYRGRIMALFSMTVIGVLPLGHLAGGAIAEFTGPRWAVFLGGAICLAGALVYRRFADGIHRSEHDRGTA
ncbi:MAG: MFS transporter [Bryobacteraceae bacterium]|nr:MFS transporter [Bryobacteraceae bacterium]